MSPTPAIPRVRATLLALLGAWLGATLAVSPFTLRHTWLPAAPLGPQHHAPDSPGDPLDDGSGPHLLCFKCVLVAAAPQAPLHVAPERTAPSSLRAAPTARRPYPRLPRRPQARAPPAARAARAS